MKKPTKEQLNSIAIEGDAGVEHYKLLAYISTQYNNIKIAEIGTHRGFGARALAYNPKNTVVTFDIKGRENEIELPTNATKKLVYDGYLDEVFDCDIIFYDASHNGKEEQEFLDELVSRKWHGTLILDDIYFNEEMRTFWDNITLPKEDWTDVGHSCGTGVVHCCQAKIVYPFGVEMYSYMLKNNQQFKFLRFGDGEFLVLRGLPKMIGKDEHSVFPAITEDLEYIIDNLNRDHYNGLQLMSARLAHISRYIPDYPWCNADVFHRASMMGELYPFIEALRNRNVVVVTSEEMKGIQDIIPCEFIFVRKQDSWLDKDMVLEKMCSYPPETVFLFCASRLSVPAIYHSQRDDCTMIDCGSLFDPYVGRLSRTYHGKLSEETIKKNLYGNLLQHSMG